MKTLIKKLLREGLLDENIQPNDIDSSFQYFMNKNLNYELQENLENAYDELKDLIKNNTIKAYRLLNVDNITEIDKNKLGKHFTTNKDNMTSEDFQEKIGIINWQGETEYNKFFVVTIETNINNVDWYKTFDNRINYYGEDEINFIDNNQLKIINVEEINIEDNTYIK